MKSTTTAPSKSCQIRSMLDWLLRFLTTKSMGGFNALVSAFVKLQTRQYLLRFQSSTRKAVNMLRWLTSLVNTDYSCPRQVRHGNTRYWRRRGYYGRKH